MSIIIGITGVIGSGKSTVSDMIRELGGFVIDIDKISINMLKRGTNEYRKVLDLFGDSILRDNSEINRKKLAGIVFNNKESLIALNNIMHPSILKKAMEIIYKNQDKKYIFLDIPLLFEVKEARKIVDKIIIVYCDENLMLNRLKENGVYAENIKKRLNNQIPIKQKLKYADYIIDNNGSIEKTAGKVKEIWEELFNE